MFNKTGLDHGDKVQSLVCPRPGSIRRIIHFESCGQSAVLQNICSEVERCINSTQTVVYKDDRAAKVAAVSCAGHRYVIKEYRSRNLPKALGRALGRSRARKTWDRSIILLEHDIPIGRPVAWIEDKIGLFCLRSFFITQQLPGTTAREYLQNPHLEQEAIQEAVEQIVRSIQQMHSRGITYGDTKDTNIVIDQKRIAWVDYDAVSKSTHQFFFVHKVMKDWQLLQYNWRDMPRIHHVFLDVLRQHFSWSEYVQLIKSFVRYNKYKMRSERRERLFENMQGDKSFGLLHLCGQSGLKKRRLFQKDIAVCNGIKNSDLQNGVSVLLRRMLDIWSDEGWSDNAWQLVRSSRTAVVGHFSYNKTLLYFKVFLPRNRFDKLKSLIRGSRCRRAVYNKKLLRTAGFNVAQVVSWTEHKGIGLMLTKAISGQNLDLFLGKPRKLMTAKEKKAHMVVLEELGKQTGILHACGFGHGDLRLSNILLRFEHERPVLYLLDNERTKFYGKVPEGVMIKNLTQINVDSIQRLSSTDRLRIFKSYQKAIGTSFSRQDQRRILRKVFLRTQKRLQKT